MLRCPCSLCPRFRSDASFRPVTSAALAHRFRACGTYCPRHSVPLGTLFSPCVPAFPGPPGLSDLYASLPPVPRPPFHVFTIPQNDTVKSFSPLPSQSRRSPALRLLHGSFSFFLRRFLSPSLSLRFCLRAFLRPRFGLASALSPLPALALHGSFSASTSPLLPRKEVIQPHLPIRLPCYDFTPVIGLTFDGCPLSVSSQASGAPNSHGVTGGVYKARERIHRDMLIRDY